MKNVTNYIFREILADSSYFYLAFISDDAQFIFIQCIDTFFDKKVYLKEVFIYIFLTLLAAWLGGGGGVKKI